MCVHACMQACMHSYSCGDESVSVGQHGGEVVVLSPVSVGQHGGVVVVLIQSVLASMVAWLWC